MVIFKTFTYITLFVILIIGTSCKSLRDIQASYVYNHNECIKKFKKYNYCTLIADYYTEYSLSKNIERFVVSTNIIGNEWLFLISNLNTQLIKKGYAPLNNETLTMLSSSNSDDKRGLITLSGNSNLVIGYTEWADKYPIHIDSEEGFTFINWNALKFWYRYYVFSAIEFYGLNDLEKEQIASDYFKYTQMLLKGNENEQYQSLTRPRIFTTNRNANSFRLMVAVLRNGTPIQIHSFSGFYSPFFCYSVW